MTYYLRMSNRWGDVLVFYAKQKINTTCKLKPAHIYYPTESVGHELEHSLTLFSKRLQSWCQPEPGSQWRPN